MFGKPPEVVPDRLTAAQYYELGTWYLEMRMIVQARESLTRSLKLEPKGQHAADCQRLLTTRMPRVDLSPDEMERMEQRILSVQTMVMGGGLKAAKRLVADYPECERPHQLLADLQLREGDVAACIASLEISLQLNPQFAPAMGAMARALTVDMDYDNARKYLRRALAITPADADLRALERSLEFLVALDDGTTV